VCTVLPHDAGFTGRTRETIEKVGTQVEARLMAQGVDLAEIRERKNRKPPILPLGGMKKPSKPKRKPLGGGGVLITRPDSNLPLFHATVVFRGGRGEERPGQAGITSVMQGAMLRGAKGMTGEDISNAFEEMGVVPTLVINPDSFGFNIEGPSARFKEAMALLGKVVATPVFGEKDLKIEKGAARGRIRASADNPRLWVMETFEELAFAAHPYGNPAHGVDKVVRGLKPAELKRWHKKSVNRANLFVAVGGDVTAANAEKTAKESFKALARGSAVKVKPIKGKRKKVRKVAKRPLRQTATAVGFPAVSRTHPDYEAFELLTWMCRGDGGRLYEEIRAKRGLAYVVHAWNFAHGNAGAFMGFSATAPETAREAEKILDGEFARFATEPPDKEELERTKRFALGMHALSIRTGSVYLKDLCCAQAAGVTMDRWLDFEKRLRKVTTRDIARVAKKFFRPSMKIKVQIQGKTDP
jgi:zinc protease